MLLTHFHLALRLNYPPCWIMGLWATYGTASFFGCKNNHILTVV